VIVTFIVSAEARYLLRAGYEEGRILFKRQPLERLVADPAVAAERRALFDLVLAARTFAADSLGLDAADTYTTFSDVGRDTLLLVLSASPKTVLRPHVWRYPIVGRVPYKGFFDSEAARAAARELESTGYDVYLRPAAAFSTLGWFNDPLLSTALYRDPVSLVSTVIHEIAHNTLYVPSATSFNESFASFVEVIFAAARDTLAASVGTRIKTYSKQNLLRRVINNASVIAARIYRTKLESFDAVYYQLYGNLEVTITAIATMVHENPGAEPYQLLEAFERW
jgi:predicted aminopeptidase